MLPHEARKFPRRKKKSHVKAGNFNSKFKILKFKKIFTNHLKIFFAILKVKAIEKFLKIGKYEGTLRYVMQACWGRCGADYLL